MKSKFIVFCLCALAFIACDTKEKQQLVKPEVSINANTTDDQKFSYMLGTQFTGPSFENIAVQLGEYFSVDYLVQGIYDNAKAQKDTNFKMSLTNEEMSSIDSHFASIADSRIKMSRPDSVTEISFNGDVNKLRAYVDSVMKTLPIKPAAPIKNVPVKIDDNSSKIEKYSYIMGSQLLLMFHGVEKQFGQDFDVDYFVHGAKEACRNVLDTSFVMALSKDSIKAINDRYVAKINEIMQKRRADLMAQLEENAKAYAADSLAKVADSAKTEGPNEPVKVDSASQVNSSKVESKIK